MPKSRPKALSSKQLLQKIGLQDGQIDPALMLSDDDTDFDLAGDLGPVLLERYHQMVEVKYDLQPGMLVTWKPGLSNKRLPPEGVAAVVIERLTQPLHDCDEGGSTYFHEPLDLVVGVFLNTGPHRGDFLIFHYDSRRFQPWTKQEG